MSCPAVGASGPSCPQPVIRAKTSRGLRRGAHIGAEPEAFGHPGPEPLYQHVGPLGQPQQQPDALGVLEVEADRPAAAGERVRRSRGIRTAGIGAVDPQHLGAQIRQDHAPERCRGKARDLDDSHTAQWPHPTASSR